MKPSQQIAEEMAHGLAVALTEENRCSIKIGDCDNPVSYHESVETAKWILKKLPLTQLIEVARAAEDIEQWLGVNVGHTADWPIQIKADCEDKAKVLAEKLTWLHQSIKALKQTGKAEWLVS